MSKVVITAALSDPVAKKNGAPHCLTLRSSLSMKLESAMSRGSYCSCKWFPGIRSWISL